MIALNRAIEKVLAVVSIALFAVLVAVVVWQVFARQVLSAPQTWTEEHSAAIRHAAPAIPAADVDELDRVWARVSAGISGSAAPRRRSGCGGRVIARRWSSTRRSCAGVAT